MMGMKSTEKFCALKIVNQNVYIIRWKMRRLTWSIIRRKFYDFSIFGENTNRLLRIKMYLCTLIKYYVAI